MAKNDIKNLVPPHSLNAEQAVLGAMLLHPACISSVQNILEPSDFYSNSNMILAEGIFQLKEKLTPVTLQNWLKTSDLLEESGNVDYIASLIENITTSAGVIYHAKIVLKHSKQRKLLNTLIDAAKRAYKDDPDEIAFELKKDISLITERTEEQEDPLEIVHQRIDAYKERARTGKTLGVLTGLKALDQNLYGLQKTCTYYLQAESQSGKSSLGLTIADNIAKENPEKSVLFFTLESTKAFLTDRRISRHSRIALTRLQRGNLYDESEWEMLENFIPESWAVNVVIIDHSKYQVVEKLIVYAESFCRDHDTILIIIDYLQLLSSSQKFQNRHLEISHITKLLNFLAKDTNCPILIMSQVNKEGEAKESRDIFNNADNVIYLVRGQEDVEAKLIGKKGRDIGTWKDTLQFNRYIQEWTG